MADYKFCLEIDNYGTWEVERHFASRGDAVAHGKSLFEQNTWRVINLVTDKVVHVHDPSDSIIELASADVNRLESHDRWVRNMVNLRQNRLARASALPTPQRSHLTRVASRQRRGRSLRDLFDGTLELVVEKIEKVNWLQEGF